MAELSPKPIVSIIVPTRNRATLLRQLLPSLADQSVSEPVELIVVDNGSYDNTHQIVREVSDRWPHVRLVREPIPGAARARHTGSELARGDILLFIDDDMRAESNVSAEHLRIHRNRGDVCVLGNVKSAQSRHPFERMMAYIYDGPRSTLRNRSATFEDAWAGHLSISRATYFRLGGFSSKYSELGCEDTDFGLRIMEFGIPFVFAEHALTHHHFTDRFQARLRRSYKNGMAYGRIIRSRPGISLSCFRPSRSAFLSYLAEGLCRVAAYGLEPFCYGNGLPHNALAIIYASGIKHAIGRGMLRAMQESSNPDPAS